MIFTISSSKSSGPEANSPLERGPTRKTSTIPWGKHLEIKNLNLVHARLQRPLL